MQKEVTTTAVLENAEEWMEEIWYDGFLRFYNNRYEQLEGLSYEGSYLYLYLYLSFHVNFSSITHNPSSPKTKNDFDMMYTKRR